MISLDSLQIQPLRGPSLCTPEGTPAKATLRMPNFNPLTAGYFLSRQTLVPCTTRSPTSFTFPATMFHPPTIENCEQLPCKHGA
ncbi:hypothetical protein BAE36_28480 [Rhizobium leguminosarum bv. trifolii]|jgi:hypothetical protein|uniref:Uncharacterized protein n=1 Tax=Rhizobium leguminosarum bv. trifolii TaxID=386 RepID=A0A1B8R551_RHILT|nr:hypothetical protein [Rhizobium leguminosarum bv. trifolii]NDK52243.1 hypothetical protein [Rhizobium laguerreae]OBY03930.1 hypothetical protein BAE36_28480 [Rhizobium leguminosarum bv. trifolii]